MSKSKYVCEQCDKVFKSDVNLNTHMKKYHGQEVLKESDHDQETLRKSENDNPSNISFTCVSRNELTSNSCQESTDNAECEQCGEIVVEDDMDAHDWYCHREKTCSLQDQGSNCTIIPANIPKAHSMWTISCDNCWNEMIEKIPAYGTHGPCEASDGFKLKYPNFFCDN